MTNPTTVDRRDVAHPTNPIGGHAQVEREDPGRPLDADADKLPAGGQGAAIRGIPRGSKPNDDDDDSGGLAGNIPPARSGQAAAEEDPADVRGQTSNSGGANRIDPNTRIPEPVKQDLGFRRTFEKGER